MYLEGILLNTEREMENDGETLCPECEGWGYFKYHEYSGTYECLACDGRGYILPIDK